MSDLMKRAEELKDVGLSRIEEPSMRLPEINAELPETTKYVIKCLRGDGVMSPRKSATGGVVATTTPSPARWLLLRADMDALPMQETSGVDFASKNNYAHTCGYDLPHRHSSGRCPPAERAGGRAGGHCEIHVPAR